MNLAPEDLDEVGRHLSELPARAVSIGDLAGYLGVSYSTARRRLQAYARAHGYVLESVRGRVGERGPASWCWYLRWPERRLAEGALREVVLDALPRDAQQAVTETELSAKVLQTAPAASFDLQATLRALLAAPGCELVRTIDGKLYRDASRGQERAVARPKAPAMTQPTPQLEPPELTPTDEQALGIPLSVLRTLKADELLVVRLLAKHGAARPSELAAPLGRAPDRVGGMLRLLRRRLHALGVRLFDDETLSDGDVLFRYVGKATDDHLV